MTYGRNGCLEVLPTAWAALISASPPVLRFALSFPLGGTSQTRFLGAIFYCKLSCQQIHFPVS